MTLADKARAKINLFLHVGPPRDDGYHELVSYAVFAALGDILEAEQDDRLSLCVEGPFGAVLEDDPSENLVLRAARAASSVAFAQERGARLTLTKNLPVASGVGGGSADAAAALRLMTRLWGAGLDEDRLKEISFQLGADIPVCVESRPRIMRGLGEVLSPGPTAQAGVILVNPGVAVSTGAIFRAYDAAAPKPLTPPPPMGDAASSWDARDLAELTAVTRNDLEGPAIAQAPVIADVLKALRGAPEVRAARMSGSGATCFGLCDDEDMAAAAAARLRAAQPSWWVAATRLDARSS